MMASNRQPRELALSGCGPFPDAAPLVVPLRTLPPFDAGLPCAPDPEEAARLEERQALALLELEARPDMVRRRWVRRA